MKKQTKQHFSLLLVIMMTITMILPGTQVTAMKEEEESELSHVVEENQIVAFGGSTTKQLQAGDWLYVVTGPIGTNTAGWKEYGAQVCMWYHRTDDEWRYTSFAENYGTNMIRIRIPSDIHSDGKFLLQRLSDTSEDPVGKTTWVADGSWGQTADLSITEIPANSNTYVITGWGTSSATKLGEWKTGDDAWILNNYCGETLYFLNMDSEISLTNLQAVFSVSGNVSIPSGGNNVDLDVTSNELQTAFNVSGGSSSIIKDMVEVEGAYSELYSVTIPTGEDYDMVTFQQDGVELASAKIWNSEYDPDTNNTYYYRCTVTSENAVLNQWDTYPQGTERIEGRTLYLSKINFPVDSEENPTIEIGEQSYPLNIEDDVYSFTVSSDMNVAQNNMFTLNYGGYEYRFFWENLNKNMLDLYKGIAAVSDVYVSGSDTRVIYFDATLSKLSYEGDGVDSSGNQDGESFALPKDEDSLWCHAWNSNDNSSQDYQLELVPKTVKGNHYGDVYKVEIPDQYDRIIFYSSDNQGIQDTTATYVPQTVDLTIPANDSYENPCFYAETGDAYVYLPETSYDTTKVHHWERSGYWGEAYHIRDAQMGKIAAGQTSTDIVNVPIETFSRKSGVLYLSTTMYDYYSDYELNGNNRDVYGDEVLTKDEREDAVNTHRIYQQFRHFNQALSGYYSENQAVSPLYWGNFQNYEGEHFNEIANTLNLYGYNKSATSPAFIKFFYENNSMWDIRGINYKDFGDDFGVNATIDLTANQLDANRNLMLNTKNGTIIAPFFDEDFLKGNNIKNTVLGDVYSGVKFPFEKEAMSGLTTVEGTAATGTVEYWHFKSADTPLRLKQDFDTGYYLEASGDTVCGATSEKATEQGNYFPFNSSNQSGDATKLNYGFGQKLEFKFRLTEDGTVLTTDNEKVPIEFTFSGDDDVWVFIDGYLVLDVGGGHGQVEGIIDFQKMKSTISSIKNTDSTVGGRIENYVMEFPAELTASSMDVTHAFYGEEHTLTMFYMERGIWESNMEISFNFPDANNLLVEKEVDTTKVDDLFVSFFQDATFDFNIKNQATHYGTVESADTSGTGFVVQDDQIPDYGSATSGKLENANGAVYTKEGRNSQSEGMVENGTFQLRDGECITFSSQFRRGSYIYLKETVNSQVYDTRWELYENDEKVSSTVVPSGCTTVVNGKTLTAEELVGITVSDGRQEVYENSPDIANSGYKATEPAKIYNEETGKTESTDQTIVFRSFSWPDDDTVGLNIKVKEINTVKTGSIQVKKEWTGENLNSDEKYQFTVSFTNVAGADLEGEKTLTKTFSLKAGEVWEMDGIPVGTNYTITESKVEGITLESIERGDTETDVVAVMDVETGVSSTVAADTKPIYIFTNKKTPEPFEFSFTKVKGSETQLQVLPGAEFELYEYSKEMESAPNTYQEFETAKNENRVTLVGADRFALKEGSTTMFIGTNLNQDALYYLVEKKAPIGMQLPNGCWKIHYDASVTDAEEYKHIMIEALPAQAGFTLPAVGYLETENANGISGWFVTNQEQWTFPDAGGWGNKWMYGVGYSILFITSLWAAVLYYQRRKRGKK